MTWETAQSILTVCMMTLAAWATGAPVVRRLGVLTDDRWGQALWAAAVGSIVWGIGLAGLGLVRLLYGPLIGLVTYGACLAGFYQLLRDPHRVFPSWIGADLLRPQESLYPGCGTSPEPFGFSDLGHCEGVVPNDRASPMDQPDPFESEASSDWEPVFEIPGSSPAGNPLRVPLSNRRLDPPGLCLSNEKRASVFWPDPPIWLSYGVLSLVAGGVLAALVVALAPPTAGDALCYHLELPKRFLQSHGIVYLPYDDTCTYPLLGEMWFLWALALDSEVAAQLVHWQWGLLFGLATVHFSRLFLGRTWAWLAGAVVLLVPGVLNQMTAPLNDVALGAMTTLALAAWWQACDENGQPLQRRQWFFLAGLALGGAASIKYTALLLMPCLAGLWTLRFWQHPKSRRSLLTGAALAGILTCSIAGLWYARAAWYRGNPVFPLAQQVWLSRVPPPQPESFPEEKSPWYTRALDCLAAPWMLTVQPERFGGRGHQLGVLWLAVLPGLLWAQRRQSFEILLGLAGGYFVLWTLVRPNVRFLLPILPMLAPAVVWVWIEMRRLPRCPRVLAGLAIACCLLVPVGWLGLRMRDHLAVAIGVETRQEFLYRKEPSYPAAALANLLLLPDAKILSQDYRSFYFDAMVVRESVYRRLTQYDQQIYTLGDLSRRLRQEGFTHLLLVENLSERGIQFDPTLARLAERELALPQSPLHELSEYRMVDADGAVRRYRLVAIR